MSLSIGIGVMGMFLKDGVDIIKFDESCQILYISIPQDSYAYHLHTNSTIYDATTYAKSIKKMLIELLDMPLLRLKYTIREGYWTKEQGEINFNKHIHEFI